MNAREFHEAMTTLDKAYRDTPSNERAEVYELAFLHDTFPAEALAVAVTRAIGELKFYPTVAELRHFARLHLEAIGALPALGHAWKRAQRACNQYVPRIREAVEYPDPITAETIRRMGGPAVIAHCELDQLDWKRKEFDTIYAELSMTAEALGVSLHAGPPRYKQVYGGYANVNGALVGVGEPRTLDTHTGLVVAPEFLEVQELTSGRGRELPDRVPGYKIDGEPHPFGAISPRRGGTGGGNPGILSRTASGRTERGDV